MKIQVTGVSPIPPDIRIALAFAPEKPAPNLPGKEVGDVRYVLLDNQPTLLISLGSQEKVSADTFRRAGAAAARWLVKNEAPEAGIDAEQVTSFGVDGALTSFCEGLLLGAYRFDRHKSEKKASTPVVVELRAEQPQQLEQAVENVRQIVDAVNLSRSWAQEPPNVINPVTLADRAQELAAELGLRCTVLDDRQLVEMGAGAITAVGKGSTNTPSRMIVLEYPGEDGSLDSPVVLVGKAITFDTGGYSLKDRTGMVGMKFDKSGGMTVLGILQAAARLKLKTPVVGIVAAAENMVSESAYRPNDIITTLSGKTVEVISADAEGRMVLCDALTYAQQKYQPRALIDLATLTGGVVIALGKLRAGYMSNSDELSRALEASGTRTHERLWRLPLDDEYFDLIKGDDSDFKNSGAREAHAIIGGIFLKQFVSPEVPWAHIDIAGTADSEKELPYSPKGATGFGVRLLVDYLQHV